MINLNQLRAFYQTAKSMSFSAAAKELFVSQPAVTKQVKSFEDHYGLNLFVRRGSHLLLTEEGKIIFEYARKIFDSEKTLEDVIDGITNLNRGSFHVGTAKTYARYFLPHLLSTFHKCYPGIDVKMDEGSSWGILRKLIDFQVQIAIVARFEDVPEVRYLPLYREEVVLIVSPEHRLAAKGEISLPDIEHDPLIMKETGSGTRKLINHIISESEFSPNIMMESSDAEMIKLLVRHGEGVSFLVRAAVSPELVDGRLKAVTIKGYPMWLEVCAGFLKGSSLSPAAKAFLRILEDVVSREGVLGSLEEFVLKVSQSPALPKTV
ncbi:MAG: LysR family transcriptional regulator [Proteobacteria bacterium]|nr:LysR family transcriptional regulator [Pseudomonadota bacterium]MBU1740535.1 LysR family transcriptional regulator [Pseudomonadota bacterium]